MMEGLYLKQFLVAHSNINISEAGLEYGDYEKWMKLSIEERIDNLADLQIKHAEAIMRKLK